MDIKYQGNRTDVMQWLEQNIPHTRLSPSGRTAFDDLNRVVYGIRSTGPQVYIRDEYDAMVFKLRWS